MYYTLHNLGIDRTYDMVHEVTGEWSRFKNGNPKYWHPYQYTVLRKCEGCGYLSTPKRVSYRPYARKLDHEGMLRRGVTYCMGCWNATRRIDAELDEVDENDRLVRKIAVEARNAARRKAYAEYSGDVGPWHQERPERRLEGPSRWYGLTRKSPSDIEGGGADE